MDCGPWPNASVIKLDLFGPFLPNWGGGGGRATGAGVSSDPPHPGLNTSLFAHEQ